MGIMRIYDTLPIHDDEIELRFIRASGPGGQNVNKVSTAVQLRFDVAHSPSLPEDIRRRLIRLAGTRITREGILIIDARRFRSQERNRDDALARLAELIRQASVRPKARRHSRPTLASKQRRLEQKRQRSRLKETRRPVSPGDG
jgi:ribosome-associated protein